MSPKAGAINKRKLFIQQTKRAQKHGWIFIQWRPILIEDFAALFGSDE